MIAIASPVSHSAVIPWAALVDLLILLTLAGCGGDRRSPEQLTADTRALAQAVLSAPPAKQAGIGVELAHTALSASSHVAGLPPPTKTPEQIVASATPATPATTSTTSTATYAPLAPITAAGAACVAWGRIIGAIGLIGWTACWVIDVFGVNFGGVAGWVVKTLFKSVLGPFYKLGASFGGAAVAVGTGLEWIGGHPIWDVLGLIAASCAWVAWVHHKDVPRWIAGARSTLAWLWSLVHHPASVAPVTPTAPATVQK